MSLCGCDLFKPGSKKEPDTKLDCCLFNLFRDLLRGPVIGNPPANAGDTGWIPALGESHVPQSN